MGRMSLFELVRLHAFISEHHASALPAVGPVTWGGRTAAELIDEQVDEGRVFDALAATMRHIGQGDFPLRFAATSKLEHLGVLGFVVQTAPTLSEALERAERFQALTSSSGYLFSERRGEQVELAWRRRSARWDLGVRVANEIVLAQQVVFARQLGARAPLQVRFRHPPPPGHEAHARFFGCAVAWGKADDAVVWPSAVLSRPLPLADQGLHRFMGEEAARRLERQHAREPLEELRRAIDRRLPSGAVTIDGVAAEAGVSVRALQRQLKAQGTSFRALVDDVRKARAQALRSAADVSLSEAALLLGFSELSAFSRAHRRWFGASARAGRVNSRARGVNSRG